MGDNQCGIEVRIGCTSLIYLCVLEKEHIGPHQIAISQDFDIRRESGEPEEVLKEFGI